MKILGCTPDEITTFTEEALYLLQKRAGVNRNCGYLTIFDTLGGGVLLVAQIGLCPAQKCPRYCVLSQEKAIRLLRNMGPLGHVSSFQSRNPDQDQWGGAILAGSIIISFSGLPDELADEAVSVHVANRMDCILPANIKQITEASQNPHIDKLAA